MTGRRNEFEDVCLRRLSQILPSEVSVTILADRGFGDHKLFAFLKELGFGYVVRFRGNIHVADAAGESRPAAEWVGKGGRARKLRDAKITAAEGYQVDAVICVHAKGTKEPWCLAASDADATAAELVQHYAKRWTIEPHFRDTKDLRFGMGLGLVGPGAHGSIEAVAKKTRAIGVMLIGANRRNRQRLSPCCGRKRVVKYLTLIRHAKAVDVTDGGADHERVLRDRGRRAAAVLGRQLAAAPPDLIMCSTAARTRETVACAIATWPDLPVVRYQRGLYLASARELLRHIEQIEPEFEMVWLVGHNPGLHELALLLARRAVGAESFPDLTQGFPTAARAVFTVDADRWHDLGQAGLALVEFAVPEVA